MGEHHADVVRTTTIPDLRVSAERRPAPWTVRVAHLITVIALPSGLWRVALTLGFSLGIHSANGVDATASVRGWGAVSILVLTLVSEGVGLLSLGLVRPWGEVVPRLIPVIGGRHLPPGAVTSLAAVGAVALTGIWTFATVNFFVLTVFHTTGRGFVFANGWWEALLIACYLPLLLWGPLLLVLTCAYYRRRTRRS